ncbi:tRNA lysidine(34) synthetase TilS [Kineococcus sp. SYSU DK004]|uniref:tRNA lysidine(34) synthetase TilS n=1 Tax=Kineococcus sp. SYSU DK004 TaxID=3383125 RepID=UPI003D7E8AE0
MDGSSGFPGGRAGERAVAAVRRAVRADLVAVAGERPGALVLVACSGGADSLALAAAAAAEAPRLGLVAGAVVVDHGLQDGSAEVAARAAAACRSLGLDPVSARAVAVGRTGGPEGAARTARYAALEAARARAGAAAVLLGHTLDDQAETVLLGLARGSGARSLAGMAPVRGHLRRPLLHLPRALVRAACAAQGLEAWEDPWNTDRRTARARVRHDALPALEGALGPGTARALARTARALRDDADALDELARRAARWEATADGPLLEVADLLGQPPAVRRRVLRAAALAAGCPAGALSLHHVEQVERLVVAWRGQGPVHLPGPGGGSRVEASRACGRLLLARRGPAPGAGAGPSRTGPDTTPEPP